MENTGGDGMSAESALPRGEEQLRFQAFVLTQIDEAVIAVDNEHRVIYWNDAAARRYGVAAEQILGRRLREAYTYRWEHPGDEEAANRSLATTGRWRGQNVHVTRSGDEIVVDSSVSVMKDGSGTPIGLLAVISDITGRKRLEKELRSSEGYLAEGQRLSHTGSWAWNVATGDLYWSQETFRLFGLHPGKTKPSHELFLRMLHPEDRPRVEQELDRAVRDRTDFNSRFRIVQRRGTIRYLHSLGHSVLDERGRVVEYVGVGIDVTVPTVAKEALARSEQRYRTIFENSPLPKWVSDPDTLRILDVNEAAVEHYGYSREEFLRMTLLDVRPPEEVARFSATIRGAPLPKGHAGVWKHRKKDGTIIDVDVFRHEINFEGRRLNLAVLQDVTQQRRDEEMLRQSEERFRSLLEHVDLLAVILDTSGRIVFCNGALLRLAGRSCEEAFGANWFDLFLPPEIRPTIREFFDEAIRTGEIPDRSAEILLSGGERRLISWSNVILRAAGAVSGTASIGEDITESHRVQQELEQSYSSLRALSARLDSIREEESTRVAREVHDKLGQVLTALQIDVQTLLEAAPQGDTPMDASHFTKLHSMGALIDEAIGAVQLISRELRPSVLDDLGLAAALESHLREFEERTGLRGRFRSSLGDTVAEGPRATAAFRIFQEILTNVARHAKAKAVDVVLDIKNGELVLAVSDDGCGVPEAKIHDRSCLGLAGMRERAHIVGGRLTIWGAPSGTTVTLAVPL